MASSSQPTAPTPRSLTLVEVKSSDGSLSGPSNPKQVPVVMLGDTKGIFPLQVTDLSYEWEVKTSWDDGRDLKAREPYFSSGEYFKEGQSELQVLFTTFCFYYNIKIFPPNLVKPRLLWSRSWTTW